MFPNRIKMTYLAPSTLSLSILILNSQCIKRAPEISFLLCFEMLKLRVATSGLILVHRFLVFQFLVFSQQLYLESLSNIHQ